MTELGALKEQILSEQAYETRVVDLDFHLHLPYQRLIPYIRDSYIANRVEEEGVPPTSARPLNTTYSRDRWVTDSHDRVHGIAANDEEIREVCDELAIDCAIVNVGTNLPFVRNNYPMVTNELVRAYHDYIIENVINVDEEIYASVFVPHWDVEFALEELDRLGSEKGIVAAQNWLTTYMSWGDYEYEPLFEKITELDLNLILHVTAGSNMWGSFINESARSKIESHVAGYGSAAMANVQNMILTGLFDKYPDLEISVQEAGTDWLPYMAYTLDERYQTYPDDIPLCERMQELGQNRLQKLPSEYVFDHIRVATQPSAYPCIRQAEHAKGLLKVCQAERTFQYTSDWPHQTLDPVEWVFKPYISQELRERILSKNAEAFLRMPS